MEAACQSWMRAVWWQATMLTCAVLAVPVAANSCLVYPVRAHVHARLSVLGYG